MVDQKGRRRRDWEDEREQAFEHWISPPFLVLIRLRLGYLFLADFPEDESINIKHNSKREIAKIKTYSTWHIRYFGYRYSP